MTVGIDIGTTSVKAVAADGSGRVVARVQVPHRLSAARDHLEHDAVEAWWEAPRRAVAGLGLSRPAAVAVAALVPSVAAVDPTGRPLGPGVLYGDARGRGSGGGPGDGADPTASEESIELLRWSAANHHDAAGHWPAQAVANRSLGGPPAVDLATAMASGRLFGSDGWDPARCAAVGVCAEQLPEVRLFGEVIGELDVAAVGTPLVAGGVDALCEQLVAGQLDPGDVLVVCGSSLVVWVVAAGAPVVDGLWTLPDLTPGRSLVGGASNAGGLFVDWVDRLVASADPRRADPAAVPVWAPWPRGERVPLHDLSLRASVLGLDAAAGPAEVRRGAFEASAMTVRDIIERVGVRTGRVVATGGGTRSHGWLQAIADVLHTKIEPVAVPEGAALGAAWLARMGVGLETDLADARRWARSAEPLTPDPRWTGPCAARYARYRELLSSEPPGRTPTGLR